MSYRHAMENLKTPPETRDAGLEGQNRRFQGFLGHTRKKNWTKKFVGKKIKISQKIKNLKKKYKIILKLTGYRRSSVSQLSADKKNSLIPCL